MEELVQILWDIFGARKSGKKDFYAPGRRRIVHILPLIITALNNERRRRILAFLLKDRDTKFSFARIKEEFSPIKKELLSYHLQALQKAWMVDRTVDLSNPIIQKDHHCSFYQISDFGLEVLDCLTGFLVMIEKDYLSKR
ncbi:hypothetical protein D4R86_03830 [bacterium]|nr:MAG: hypothetical protein D4R86_03830 [bacterium]